MPRCVDGVIDDIDRLVDEQLADGEPKTGYDFDDPQYPRCWHCGRHFHGLPITEKIADMYAVGEFDEDYRLDDDDSRVLCRGSDFIGPMPSESDARSFTPWRYRSRFAFSPRAASNMVIIDALIHSGEQTTWVADVAPGDCEQQAAWNCTVDSAIVGSEGFGGGHVTTDEDWPSRP